MGHLIDEDPSASDLSRAWMRAAETAVIADALRGVYSEVAAEIARRGPSCWASGRCCNFDKAGHRLYVTGLEAAYALAQLPVLRVDDPVLTLPQLGDARARGGCPFQVSNLCGIHTIKPLGCRVYFCDRSAQDWQHELTESGLRRIRAIHDQFDVPYRYGEWRGMLEMLRGWDMGSGNGEVGNQIGT
ncbi:MAG: YkgJ family cysteine cluster protein [Pyrinomonadaceae bacterium]|nr:YkgJ family cysteine cluster protein [Phycisphaerales bacterium]